MNACGSYPVLYVLQAEVVRASASKLRSELHERERQAQAGCSAGTAAYATPNEDQRNGTMFAHCARVI